MKCNSIKEEFKKNCEKNGFIVFEAEMDYESDCLFLKREDFFKFCSLNKLNTIFLTTVYDEEIEANDEISIDSIKNKLTNYFKNYLKKYSFMFIFEYINEAYYKSILDDALEKADEELASCIENFTMKENNKDENTVLLINALTIFNGAFVSTHVYDKNDDEEIEYEENSFSEKSFLDRYAGMIVSGIHSKKLEAMKENMRIKNEKRAEALGKIKEDVEKDLSIENLKTQKIRNEYADRIYSKLIMQDDNNWLTKKAIREIVDQVYYSRTELDTK